jgi:serpin B
VTDLAFTLALHRAIAADPGRNACWSPYSLASALGLVAVGAGGMTRDELVALLLGEKSAELGELAKLVAKAARLDRVDADTEEPVLAVANTLWTDASIPIRTEYAEELAAWPGGSVRPAPFRHARHEARELINRDVNETTRGLIPELVPDGAVNEETVAALVNALYLKCAWINRFAEGATRPLPFHAPAGTIQVPTMELSEWVGYAARDGWQVVSLPAAGGVRAVVLLPEADLAVAEADLTTEGLARLLEAPRPAQVQLHLPKLKVSMQAELSQVLEQRGVRTVFTDDADLTGISPKPLAVQAVLHEAVLTLDEQGLEGAAATAVMFRLTAISMGEPVTVHVDRPFLLLIQHSRSGAVYFMARVVTPDA